MHLRIVDYIFYQRQAFSVAELGMKIDKHSAG
jgi:hypothetical protein